MFITFFKSGRNFDTFYFLIHFFFCKAFECENHVRVLLRRKTKYNDIFVCSTNAFSPKIYYFNVKKVYV